jgi:hypothetical protein
MMAKGIPVPKMELAGLPLPLIPDFESKFGMGIGSPIEPLDRLKSLSGLASLPKSIRMAVQARNPVPALDRIIEEGLGIRFNPANLQEGAAYLYNANGVNLLVRKLDKNRIEIYEVQPGLMD